MRQIFNNGRFVAWIEGGDFDTLEAAQKEAEARGLRAEGDDHIINEGAAPYEDDDYFDDNPRDLSEWVGPEFADEVSLEERWAHYAYEERNGMAYGSSF